MSLYFPKRLQNISETEPRQRRVKVFKPALSANAMDASYQSKPSQVETAVLGLSLTGYTDSAKSQLTELLEKTSTLPPPPSPSSVSKTAVPFN